jgi:hypothetical protein
MKKCTLIILTLSIQLGFVTAQTQIGFSIDGEATGDQFGKPVSMPDLNTVAIGGHLNDGSGTDAGHVRINHWNGSDWLQKGGNIEGEAAGDHFGETLSMPDSNTVAIGAHNNDGNGTDAGHVRIFSWSGSAWLQKGGDIDGEAAGDFFGFYVSMPDSNTVAIGATRNDGNGLDAGHVRIFRWNGSSWIQKGADIDGEAADDYSGLVSMPDSNTVAISASGNSPSASLLYAGHVRIFNWNGLAWIQKGVDIDGELTEDGSGHSMSMPDSNTVAIGAPFNDGTATEAGHVRIFKWNGLAWIQKGIDIDGTGSYANLGMSVSMPDSNTVAIGANGLNAIGVVSIFKWNGLSWFQKCMDITGEVDYDWSNEISMPDSNTVAIGSAYYAGKGYVRVFSVDCTAGIETQEGQKAVISIYPNPTDGSITISGSGNSTIIITNLIGEVILTDTKEGTYDLNAFDNGIFFVSVLTPQGLITSKIVLVK